MRSTHRFLASMVALSGVALVGCPGPSPSGDPDTGVEVNSDGGVITATDAAQPTSLPPLVIGEDRSSASPANYGCIGENSAPTAGDPVSATVTFSALALSSFPVANGAAELYPGAAVRASCDGDCVAGTTGSDGTMTATLPGGGWFAYRLAPAGSGSSASVAVLGNFYTWPEAAGGNVTVTAISESVAEILTNQINRTLSSETAAVSGSVRDCDGEEVAKARVRFFRGDTEIVSGPESDTTTPFITGLSSGTIPSASSDGLTGYGGRFAGTIPPGGTVRIEAWGSLAEGAEPVLLGCEEVNVEPNTVTVAVVPALRGDYPAGHSCAGR